MTEHHGEDADKRGVSGVNGYQQIGRHQIDQIEEDAGDPSAQQEEGEERIGFIHSARMAPVGVRLAEQSYEEVEEDGGAH